MDNPSGKSLTGQIFLLLLTGTVMQACQGMQIRDRETLAPVAEKARAGNENAVKAMESALVQTTNEPLKREVISEMGTVKTPRARETLKQKLSDDQLRGAAALAYSRHKDGINNAEIDREIADSIQKNQLKQGTLTQEEIQVLGESSDPRATRLLKTQLGIHRENDALVIQALAKQLERSLSARGENAPQIQTEKTETGIPQLPEKSDVADSPTPEKTPAVTQPLPEEDFIPSVDDPELDAKGDQDDGETAEQVLREYTESDAPENLKDLALGAIYQAYKEEGRAHLLSLSEKPDYSMVSRQSILMFLARKAKSENDSSLIADLQILKKRHKRHKAYVKELNNAIAFLKDLPPPKDKPASTTTVKRSSSGKSYVREKDPELPKKTYAHKNERRIRDNLQSTLVYYGLPQNAVSRMESRVRRLLYDSALQHNSERNLIFTALERLYPGQDYFTLKKYGSTALDTPWYFTTTLQLITKSGRGKHWQIAAISRIWDLSTKEASLVRALYLKEGKILAGKMKL